MGLHCSLYYFYKMFAILLVLLMYVLHQAEGYDYCAPQLCGDEIHVACNNSGAWYRNCPKNVKEINLRKYENLILDEHNFRRNRLASGRVEGYSPAKHMAIMKWDKELAKLAKLNVRKCYAKADACRNVKRFRNVGQIISVVGYANENVDMPDNWIIKDTLERWWDYKKLGSQKEMDYLPRTARGLRLFAIMARQKNKAVGCAAIRFRKIGRSFFLMTCNYATNYAFGKPTYTSGYPTAGCKTGKDTLYPNLCSADEVFAGL